MLQAKRKISKRELKQDALITTYMKATAFYEQYKKNISIGLTTAVVLIIAVVIYVNNRNANNEKATTDLGKVYQYYDSGQYQLAIDGVPERNIPGLKSIVENYGSSPAGEMARFYLADAYFLLGKYDDALHEFEDFSPKGDLLAVSRLAGIAGCYEAKKDWKNAAEYFEKAVGRDAKDINAAENLGYAARNYALAGEKEKALSLYKKLKKNYPTSTFARDADRYIAQLSV
jgi:tetratricopeptide (TPR) repeat protein